MVGWSELPEDIVEHIAKRLTFILDFTRFGAVCRSWRFVESKKKRLLTPQPPFLMHIMVGKDGGMIYNYYSLSENKKFEFTIPKTHGIKCVGSTEGWILTVDDCFKMLLLNPFTSAQIELPPKATLKDKFSRDHYSQEELWHLTVWKASLSSSPSSNNECVVLTIHGYWRLLSFARLGDEVWTPVDCVIQYFDDAIYYKGKFYALNVIRGVFWVDISINPSTILITNPIQEATTEIGYLVEWCGELLQVLRQMDLDMCSPGHQTLGFRVFKLDFSIMKWEEVKSLGHYALFLGWNTSISLNAAILPGINENCIYFSDIGHPLCIAKEILQKDIGIFYMKDKSIEPLHTGLTYCFHAPPLWVIPNP
ncbi:F-box protein At2g26160-like [Macadamia integrifolia]|uniref:F-box protein At2g26160-like n=1 Tax=Macadamia integrifolia TaxID=60698 RepID=UPI001C4F60C2|nr:F-box protein At2g26160-like [Macadamia integrifolia]XP_042498636.1 F-box protein At2g26160-like [Macadamia integrifolia]XP_042498643.1 F-box protein At2g26160-like [Macadamia integrifolia]XP_042498652.1 F-box protein At2g26160-like [Macadamia integrifolia]